MDKISVIVPVYNVDKYLSSCIESIINQNYKNIEILLIDDGSVDDSAKICKEYAEKDKRVKIFFH
ncbi:glycosyltransferase family 2 protein [Streptococcus suis]|uniref:glycosyltransferase family 2 protein n=1 Tax=Streptococcus suis TaxID=1307 RepID=UPI00221E3823|nr:glycosyltransferase [Streptococcus suis]